MAGIKHISTQREKYLQMSKEEKIAHLRKKRDFYEGKMQYYKESGREDSYEKYAQNYIRFTHYNRKLWNVMHDKEE